MATADVVVIGGGVNGASTAFHLASLGVKRVTLVERRQLAAGASGMSGWLVRMHYTNDVESRLAHESLKVFQKVAEVTLRRPLRPDEIKALVTGLEFQAEFFSGREFGLRVRGEGILLLHRVRETLQALAAAGRPASGDPVPPGGAQAKSSATAR